MLGYIEDPTDGREAKLKKDKDSFLEIVKPVLLDASPESDDMRIQKDHEMMGVNLQRHGISDPDKMNTLAFFSLIEDMEIKELEHKTNKVNRKIPK